MGRGLPFVLIPAAPIAGLPRMMQPKGLWRVSIAIATLVEAVQCKTQTPPVPATAWIQNIRRIRLRPQHHRRRARTHWLSLPVWLSFCSRFTPLRGVMPQMSPPRHLQAPQHPLGILRQHLPPQLARPHQAHPQAAQHPHLRLRRRIRCLLLGQILSPQIKAVRIPPVSQRPIQPIPKVALAVLLRKHHLSTNCKDTASYADIFILNTRPVDQVSTGLFAVEH